MANILIIGAVPESITNFRGDLIKKFVNSGHNVTAMASRTSNEITKNIEKTGARFIPYGIERNRINIISDFTSFISILRTFSIIKPDIVLAYTIKPIISTGIASLFFKNVKFYALITGLGYVFQKSNIFRTLLKRITYILYYVSLRPAKKIIFQNHSNMDYMINRNIVKKENCSVVLGSGVNLKYYSIKDFHSGSTTFLLIARLLKEKGIREYIESAKSIKKKYYDVKFMLVGGEDPSLDSIPVDHIKSLDSKNIIEYYGEVKDVRPYIQKCHIYVLPSYHEGMPRTVLEAMSMGRPIITTDVPGCRDTVENNKNGFIINSKNSNQLEEKMIWYIKNTDRWEEMGKQSRYIAKKFFDVNKINEQYYKIMELAS